RKTPPSSFARLVTSPRSTRPKLTTKVDGTVLIRIETTPLETPATPNLESSGERRIRVGPATPCDWRPTSRPDWTFHNLTELASAPETRIEPSWLRATLRIVPVWPNK